MFVIEKLPGAFTELAENFPTFMFQTSVEPKGLQIFNFSLEYIVHKNNSFKSIYIRRLERGQVILDWSRYTSSTNAYEYEERLRSH